MTQQHYHYGPACDLIPGTIGKVRGWYLIAANGRVEAGAFASEADALAAAEWLDDNSRGVHPYPWTVTWARQGLLVGTRLKKATRKRVPPNTLTG